MIGGIRADELLGKLVLDAQFALDDEPPVEIFLSRYFSFFVGHISCFYSSIYAILPHFF